MLFHDEVCQSVIIEQLYLLSKELFQNHTVMSQYSNKNLIMETEGEEHLEILHNFEDFEDMMQDLTMPMAKELFMAHLGLSKLTSTSDTQSNSSSYYLVSSQESKRISSEEKTKCHVSELFDLGNL